MIAFMLRFVRRLRLVVCRHEFRLAELTYTGILQPAKPAINAGYAAWLDYYLGLSEHPANSQRVSWPCAKCGKEFRAHCGLDILSRGKMIDPPSCVRKSP